eukprot:TRINITY_DN5199_c0_g6_i1.p1 TRINITY_DN5199_c0_g6~~TRINITY_DN5199_c0_g6_i1.p1  ORF type:complete len:286 (+),score=70.13 TRINITY_DN5199_c0_g6_i1:162-1019(+)
MWLKACLKGGDYAALELVWAQMCDNQVRMDVTSFATRIHSLALQGEVYGALCTLDHMVSVGVPPNQVCWGSAMHACAVGGDTGSAWHLLARIKIVTPIPPVVVYASMMNCCAKAKDGEGAIAVLEEMEKLGVDPNLVVLNSVLNALQRSWHVEQGWRSQKTEAVLQMILNNGFKPDNFTLCSLVKMCGEDYHAAEKLIKQYKSRHLITPNERVLSALAVARKRGGCDVNLQNKPAVQHMDGRSSCSALKKKSKASEGRGRQFCRFFNTPRGCNNGESCPFIHQYS